MNIVGYKENLRPGNHISCKTRINMTGYTKYGPSFELVYRI